MSNINNPVTLKPSWSITNASPIGGFVFDISSYSKEMEQAIKEQSNIYLKNKNVQPETDYRIAFEKAVILKAKETYTPIPDGCIQVLEASIKSGTAHTSPISRYLKNAMLDYSIIREKIRTTGASISAEQYVLACFSYWLSAAVSSMNAQDIIQGLNGEIDKLVAEKNEFKSTVADLQDQIKVIKEAVNKPTEEQIDIEKLQADLISARREAKQIRAENATLQKKIKRLEEDAEKKDKEIERQKSKAAYAEDQYQFLLEISETQDLSLDRNSKIYFAGEPKNSAEERTLQNLIRLYPNSSYGINIDAVPGCDCVCMLAKYLHHHSDYWRIRDCAKAAGVPIVTSIYQNVERVSEDLDKIAAKLE